MNAVLDYPGRPDQGVSFFGEEAGKRDQYGDSRGGSYRYNFLPITPSDWTADIEEPAATSKRSLGGFIARTFVVVDVDPPVPGGLFFRRNANGTQTVLSDAQVLYDFNKTDQPVLDIGDEDIPEVLKSILRVNGTQYDKSDLVYKGDTSTD